VWGKLKKRVPKKELENRVIKVKLEKKNIKVKPKKQELKMQASQLNPMFRWSCREEITLSQNSQHQKKTLKRKSRPCTPDNVKGRPNKKIGGNSITSYFK